MGTFRDNWWKWIGKGGVMAMGLREIQPDHRRQASHVGVAKREDILVRFGRRERELRKEQGYSQKNFAYACGLDRTYVGGIEGGERNLALRNIEKIADTLSISIAELMDGV